MNQIANINQTNNDSQLGVSLPHSIEAEQQLLGAILTNNEVYDRIAAIISAEHFFEPVHARIFELSASRIGKNNLASAVTLSSFMKSDEGLQELGGGAYLARLAASAIAGFAVRDYAHMIQNPAIIMPLLSKLKHRHSAAQLDQWSALIDQQDWHAFIKSLLDAHYDPAYKRSGSARRPTGCGR